MSPEEEDARSERILEQLRLGGFKPGASPAKSPERDHSYPPHWNTGRRNDQ